MRILLLGGGGRESALAWKISQSHQVDQLFISPGNAGTLNYGQNVDLDIHEFEEVEKFVIGNEVNMIVVGPEQPLVDGISDFFSERSHLSHVRVVGPSEKGAHLEGSKAFAKEFMDKYSIPTAKYKEVSLDTLEEGNLFLDKSNPPYVLKADGLAAGKGVVILDSLDDAKKELSDMLYGKFGQASNKVVIEEFLSGIEFSVFVAFDDKNWKILPVAKDYKRIGEGDTGLNTGGMGAVSPPGFVDDKMMEKVIERVIIPTVNGLMEEAISYRGIIFLGLIEVDSDPYVIEYNCRFGDPETEAIVPRIQSDIVELFSAIATQDLESIDLKISDKTAATVMLVSEGYPGKYEKGKIINGIDARHDALIFQAGTTLESNEIVTNGGRVIAITALGDDKESALKTCYETASNIDFEGKTFRGDIGFDL